MSEYLKKKQFKDINLDDSFFDTLKSDYPEFESWFRRKKNEYAFIQTINGLLQGFLYLKIENGPIRDTSPEIQCSKVLKIGTLKITPHGTRLGERFIKKALDYATSESVEICYVTIYEKHEALIKLFKKYGFIKYGFKSSNNGQELVLVKNLRKITNNILHDYPLLSTNNKQKFLLAIYPQYHSIMFPDSILRNESIDILEDVTITNSIHKTYVTRMPLNNANPGDILVMYRTKSENQSAEYSAVATSVCVIEEVRHQNDFSDFEDFYKYATTYSIFDKADLRYWHNTNNCFVVKMTYNAALSKRLIRKKLIKEIGIERNIRWGFIKLTDDQFNKIIKEGGVHESLIVN